MMNQNEEMEDGGVPELTEEEKKRIIVGHCNYTLLMILSLAATILGTNATWFCDFVNRDIEWQPGWSSDRACEQANLTKTDLDQQTCAMFFDHSAVGFYHWMATVPVNAQYCVSYTINVPNVGIVDPAFDAAFNAAKVFSVMANFFGLMGWFTIIFASCCPVSQSRIAGLSCYFSLACTCQCFTFLIFASDICEGLWFSQYWPSRDYSNIVAGATCSLGSGANQSIAACVLYAVCSSLAPASTAPPPIGYSRAPTYYTNTASKPPTQQQQQQQQA